MVFYNKVFLIAWVAVFANSTIMPMHSNGGDFVGDRKRTHDQISTDSVGALGFDYDNGPGAAVNEVGEPYSEPQRLPEKSVGYYTKTASFLPESEYMDLMASYANFAKADAVVQEPLAKRPRTCQAQSPLNPFDQNPEEYKSIEQFFVTSYLWHQLFGLKKDLEETLLAVDKLRDSGVCRSEALDGCLAPSSIKIILADMGYDIDKCDKPEMLSMAIEKGWPATVAFLVNTVASKDIILDSDMTPLHLASKFGQVKVATVLLQLKANYNAVDESHYAPLHRAVESGSMDTVDLLLKAGADTRIVGEDGNGLLHIVAARGYAQMVDKFVELKISQAPNKQGDMPLHIAVAHGHFEIVEKIVNTKSKPGINAVNSSGETPLQIAVRLAIANNDEKYKKMVLCLLHGGASVSTGDLKNMLSELGIVVQVSAQESCSLQ